MSKTTGNRPAEIFGFLIGDKSDEAENTRRQHWCPFVNAVCNKKSRLIDYPFGVCSAERHGEVYTVCPRRFEEPGTVEGTPRVLEDIALHYFGDLANVIPFAQVSLRQVGTIDYVLVRHKQMKPEVEDFVAVEIQADSTTSTGGLVQGLRDFIAGEDVQSRMYDFGMNTYDTIKRSLTQLLNKGIVYETWNVKGYWVVQEYIYANLVNRYGLRKDGYKPEHASRFALYALALQGKRLSLVPTRFVSTAVDEIYQAMRHSRSLPDKFVKTLNTKLQARLSVKFG